MKNTKQVKNVRVTRAVKHGFYSLLLTFTHLFIDQCPIGILGTFAIHKFNFSYNFDICMYLHRF